MFNSAEPTSTRSHHRALSYFIRISWNRSENARIRSLSSSLAPIIFQIAQQHWVRSEKSWLGGAELHSQSQTEFLLHSLRTDEASIDRVHSRLRGISCCLTRKMHHLSRDQKLSTHTASLFGEYYQAETQDSLPLSICSTRSASKFSLFSEQVHSSWNESGQASSMARVLPRTRAEKYATLLEPLEKAFQEKSNSNSRVSRWAKPSSGNQCRCHDWTCSSILLGGLQRKGNLLSESRSDRIQVASSWKTSRTSIETVCVQHQRSASVHLLTENENIKRSWEGVEQAAQIDSSLTLRRHSPNIQWGTHREHLFRALENVEDDTPTERKSTNDGSSSIFANKWKTMLFFHQNNRVFTSTTQRQRDSCSFCNTSALASYNKPLLTSYTSISPRLSINSGMTVYFTNCTKWVVHKN